MIRTANYSAIIILAVTAAICSSCREKRSTDVPAAFQMKIEDVFFIPEKGVVVTGLVDSGKVLPGDTLQLVRTNRIIRLVNVVGIERFGESLPSAQAGDKVGIQLADIQKADLSRNDILQTAKQLQ